MHKFYSINLCHYGITRLTALQRDLIDFKYNYVAMFVDGKRCLISQDVKEDEFVEYIIEDLKRVGLKI